MVSFSKQKGMGSLGWLVVLSVAGFFLLCFFRLGPSYLNNRYVVAALKSLADEPELHELSKSEILSKLRGFSAVNGLRGEEANSFSVVRMANRTLVNSVYEQRVHIFHNIDVVMTFKNQLDSSDVESCCVYLIEDESKK